MCRNVGRGTSARTSCRATPLPQSMTYAVLLLMMTWADAELDFRGRGPPPVPRRISLVFPVCALLVFAHDAAVTRAAAPRRKPRLSTVACMPNDRATHLRSHEGTRVLNRCE